MKSCKKTATFIYREIDGTLTEKEAVAFKTHRDSCPACQEEYRLTQGILHALSEEDSPPLPQGFHQDLLQKLSVQGRAVPFFFKRPAFRYAVTACLALIITVYGFQGNFPTKKITLEPLPENTTKADLSLQAAGPSESEEPIATPDPAPTSMREAVAAINQSREAASAHNRKDALQESITENAPIIAAKNAVESVMENKNDLPTMTPAPEEAPQEAPQEALQEAPKAERSSDTSSTEPIPMAADATKYSEAEEASPAKEETPLSHASGGAGSSASVVYRTTTEELYTLRVKGDFNPAEIEGAVSVGAHSYRIPMTQLVHTLNLLEGQDYVVENAQAKDGEWFLIIVN